MQEIAVHRGSRLIHDKKEDAKQHKESARLFIDSLQRGRTPPYSYRAHARTLLK